MDTHKTSEVICVFGIRGSGKTTWTRKYVDRKPNVIAFDFLSQFNNMVVIQDYFDLREYFEKGKPSTFRISFRPVSDIDYFPLACVLVKSIGIAYGNVIFCIDEVDRYCSATWEPPEFRELISQGRHYNVSLICTSRTPAEVSKLLTSQASKFVCFTMHEKRHVEYICSHIGEQGYRLPTLPFYQSIEHDFQQAPHTPASPVDAPQDIS